MSLSLTVVPGAVGEVLLMALGRIAFEPVDEPGLGRSEGQPVTPGLLEHNEKLPTGYCQVNEISSGN